MPHKSAYEPFRRNLAEVVIQLNMLNGQYELVADAVEYEIAQQGAAPIWLVYKGDAKRSAAAHPEFAAREYAWLHDVRADEALTKKFQQQVPDNLLDAIADYERALKLSEKTPEALRGIGLAAQAQGDKVKAKDYLQRYLASAEAPADRRYIQNLLKHIDQD